MATAKINKPKQFLDEARKLHRRKISSTECWPEAISNGSHKYVNTYLYVRLFKCPDEGQLLSDGGAPSASRV